jgi:RHS repeat-associated protein
MRKAGTPLVLMLVIAFAINVAPAPYARAPHSGSDPDVPGRLRALLTAGLSRASASVASQEVVGVPGTTGSVAAGNAVAGPGLAEPKRVRELVDERTPTARFFELSDGRTEAEVASTPEAYRSAAGGWRPIDTRIRPSDRRGYGYGNETNQFATLFGDRSDRLARFALGGRSVTVGTAGEPRPVSLVIDDDSAIFKDRFSAELGSADLVYRVTADALKEEIVLEHPPSVADPSYVFVLRLGGVDARSRGDGSIAFFRKGAGVGEPALFVIPKPFMTDARQDLTSPYGLAWSDKVTQTVTQRGSHIEVSVRPDSAWLTSQDRQYPVTVDPTITVEPTPTTGQDAMIKSTTSMTKTTNYGTSWQLGVGTDATGAARSLLKFDVSWIPAGTLIDAADLKVWYDQGYYTNANSVSLEAHRITASWSESTVTWSNFTGGSGELVGTAVTKAALTNGRWHAYNLKDLAKKWVDGTVANYGVMLRATSETTLGRGGASYEAAEYAYNGGIVNRPKLVITYGKPGVTVDPITTMYSTGARVTWSAYVDPSTATGDDIVEYQVHRDIHQRFIPTAATLVAPVAAGTTTFTDSTAPATAADDNPDSEGNAYYYMVAVKTKDGSLVPASTRLARLPVAGRLKKLVQGTALDTTLSSANPATNYDVFDGEPWLGAGDNGGSFGRTRTLVKFTNLSSAVPTGATVVNADLVLWKPLTFGSGAIFDLYGLTRDFSETTATWNRATSTTSWTTPGGDYDPTLVDYVPSMTNDPKWHVWYVDSLVQQWVTTPSSNKGVLIKARAESTPNQLSVFYSTEKTAEPLLRPMLSISYLEKTAASTYYAPFTPSRMIPGDQYTVDVTLTNTTTLTWATASQALSYHWTLPDGTDVTTSGNRLDSSLPPNVAPGQTVVVQAQVKTPIQSGSGNKREAYVLKWDLRNKATNTWLSDTGGIPALAQNVAVEDPTSSQLGLEQFYSYAGKNTGAGSTAVVNQAAGNLVWSYDAFANPSRGPSTFLRLAYNSLDTSTSSAGYGWSVSASSVMRLGSPLDLHPHGQAYPTDVTLTDGDGSSHLFTLNTHGSTDPALWTYDSPAGVHLYLQKVGGTDPTRTWVMTRPDRTKFYFDTEGYQSATVDKNNNTLTFTYEQRQSNNRPVKFVKYLTDAASRQTLTIDYFEKGENYSWIDDTGTKVSGTNLTNPFIIDQIQSITDVDGRTLAFTYTDKGLLGELIDGSGSSLAKTFRFTYDATQGNKNVKLISVKDPRGNSTRLGYYDLPTDDPKFHWWAKTITDRPGFTTSFAYLDPDGSAGSQIQTTVTDPETHATVALLDGFGRATQLTNAKSEVTKLAWDADNNVTRLEEPNHAFATWTYDPKTGYPLTITDAEANANATPATVLTYQSTLNGYVADLVTKRSPEGRTWTFAYDARGNLTSVTDPKGTATAPVGDYTTTYTYDGSGQLLTATDANEHTTTYGTDYDPTGYPKTITQPAPSSGVTSFTYDARGNVLIVTDANQKTSSYTYDLFFRPGESRVPKTATETIVTPAPVYDPNDNVTTATAPNGGVTSYTYDKADRVATAVSPPNSDTGPQRTVSYGYDKVGNLVSQTEPKGNLTPTDPSDFVTTYGYDPVYRLTSVTNADSDNITYVYDTVGNLTTVVDPRKNETTDPNDFTTTYTYDRAHRVKTVTDAAGKVAATGYDLDGKVVSTTDKQGATTLLTLDERAMLAEVKVPHDNPGGTISYRITRYEYDEVGNRTHVVTPRGVETSTDLNDFAYRTVYDELNRVKEQQLAYDPDDSTYNTPDKVTYSYDQVGRLQRVSAPPSAGQTVRNDTTYTYFDNGWAKTATDPWDIVTTYNYNPLGQQTSRVLTSAAGSGDNADRSMTWDYYLDGSLKTRSDAGVPAGRALVLVDNSDTQNVTVTGTWATGTAGSFQGYNYRTHAGGGTSTNKVTWRLVIPRDGTYQVFVRYPAVSGSATDAKFTVKHSAGSTVKTVNQTTGAGSWVSLSSFGFTKGGAHDVTLTDQASGIVVADAVKLVRDNTGEPDNEGKTLGYGYDPNGNLTSITDTSSGAAIDSYAVDYDGVNRVAQLREKAGATTKRTTSYTYDANGNPRTVDHDDQDAVYTYDTRDLLSTVSITEPGRAAKVTTYNSYTPNGWRERETKANGNTVDYTYYLDGLLRAQTEKKPAGALVASHDLAYTPNGDKARDISLVMDADNHANLLDRTTVYTYDPLDRIATVTKTDTSSGASVSSESYTHDAANHVIAQTITGSPPTTFTYDRNRLQSSTTGATTISYNYDPFGRLDSVTSGTQIIESYAYDGFDRIAEHTQLQQGGSSDTTKYAYDPLDRTASRTDHLGAANQKTTAFGYLGLSEQLISERDIAGVLLKSYQYSPWGQRLSQVKRDTGGAEDSYYGYTPHTDVETLTTSTGDTRATYGYTAYGHDDTTAFTGVDKPDPANPQKDAYNPYRYTGKRLDPATGNYDMGFRDYDPGLNQFLSRDLYNGALADLTLATDPWTNNRYAFTGGNPITGIELDGHCYVTETGVCVGTATKADAYNTEHPPPPAPRLDDTDLDRPAFGSEPFTDRDREVLKQLLLLQFGADTVKGWDNAVALLGHWLGSSGDPHWVDPAALLGDLPGFRSEVQRILRESPSGEFDTGWRSIRATETESLDWFYALNRFQFRVSGNLSWMDADAPVGVFTIQVYKRFNFGTREEGRNNITAIDLFGRNLIDIPQEDIAHLHATGDAQDFDVWGSRQYDLLPSLGDLDSQWPVSWQP